jgi:hypothetical protein
VIKTGKLSVNLDAKTVEVDGSRVHLTGKEYAMLELLSLRKGTTLTKEMFLNHLYGGMDEPELKIIDVFICKLRKKLSLACGGENYIETVWGRATCCATPRKTRPPRWREAFTSCRHCEQSEAIHLRPSGQLDCRVAALLAMTEFGAA